MKKFIISAILLLTYIYSYVKWMVPYNRAKIAMAYSLYMDTTMYKERALNFGKEFAFSSFIENGEHRYFLKKLTFFDKVKATFIPYSYMGVKKEEISPRT